MLSLTGDALLMLDDAGTIVACSPGPEAILRAGGGALPGVDLRALVHRAERRAAGDALRRALTDGSAVTELRIDPRGQARVVEVMWHRLSQSGRVRLGLVCRDATAQVAEREALRRSEHRYRAVVDGVEEGVLVIGAHGRVESYNLRAAAILGLDDPLPMGTSPDQRPWDTIRPDGSRVEIPDLPSAVVLRTGRACPPMVMGLRRSDGSTVCVRSSVTRCATP
ncbi:MAG TPA: PAS domain-containing protein [Gaiellales bacterium]|nr:PAS domain-containing protein [Gaiellales bacterium]